MIKLLQLFNNVKQLPVLPILLLELMESFSDEDVRVEEIAKKNRNGPINQRESYPHGELQRLSSGSRC